MPRERRSSAAVLSDIRGDCEDRNGCLNDAKDKAHRTWQEKGVFEMTLLELQDALGRAITQIENGTGNIDKAKAIASLAKQMINNADVMLRTDKFVNNKGKRIDKVVGEG